MADGPTKNGTHDLASTPIKSTPPHPALQQSPIEEPPAKKARLDIQDDCYSPSIRHTSSPIPDFCRPLSSTSGIVPMASVGAEQTDYEKSPHSPTLGVVDKPSVDQDRGRAVVNAIK